MNNQNYYRPGGFGGFSFFPPVIKFLLISNIVITVASYLLFQNDYNSLPPEYKLSFWDYIVNISTLKYFALQPFSNAYSPFLPWQLITYMFMHAGFSHLFFNMFALWMFGMELENLWGSKKFLIYYTICGVGAAAANLFISPLFGAGGPSIGASGAIYGILVAFGFIFPNRNIYIYFLIPIKAKYLVILYMALEVIYLASSSQSGIAHAAHLGGAVVGFIYLLITQRGSFNLFDKISRWKSQQQSYTPPMQYYQPPDRNNEVNTSYEEVKKDDKEKREEEQQRIQARIDEILDKLGKGGYNSLTDEEKRVLFEESKKLR